MHYLILIKSSAFNTKKNIFLYISFFIIKRSCSFFYNKHNWLIINILKFNIDYILLLVKKYHDTHGTDKEILITIQKAVDASPELRSKKALIETFISGINDVEDVLTEWHGYVAQEKEKELSAIIADEKLNESETRKFIDNAFRDGEIKTTGTDIDKLMPPTSRFGGGNRAEKKRGIIEKLKGFFERFFGI